MSESPAISYAAIWTEADDPPSTGSVALLEEGMALSGARARPSAGSLLVRYGDVLRVEVVRNPHLRLNGYPTLEIERRRAPRIRVSTIGLGALSELNHLLATAMRTDQPQLAGIVVPLRRHSSAAASALIEDGPPFDLAALGINRHEVLLSEREAIFLFEGPRLNETAERLVRDPSLWKAASGWAQVVAGPPRLAEQRFGWHQGRRTR